MIPSITFLVVYRLNTILEWTIWILISFIISSSLKITIVIKTPHWLNKDSYHCTIEIQILMILPKEIRRKRGAVPFVLFIQNVRGNSITHVRVKCVHIISFLVGRWKVFLKNKVYFFSSVFAKTFNRNKFLSIVRLSNLKLSDLML